MAACNLASVSNIKVFNSGFKKLRCNVLDTPYKMKCNRLLHMSKGTHICQEPVHAVGFDRMGLKFTQSLAVSCGSTSKKNDSDVVESDEDKSSRRQVIPQSLQVEPLLATICDTASIAEFKLEIAGFRLYVKRSLVDNNVPAPVPNLAPMQANTASSTPDLNGSPATNSFAISKAKPSTDGIQRIVDTASDEGLVVLQSPKVGFFRRSRTIKGKRAPASCKEKQQVKEGQVVCYVEQLGGEIPIESDVSGEVIKILREDGEPVGYGDALIAILPSFPGIKLQ